MAGSCSSTGVLVSTSYFYNSRVNPSISFLLKFKPPFKKFSDLSISHFYLQITNIIRCCNSKKQTPKLLKFAVNGVTEFLRLFSSFNYNNNRMDRVVADAEQEFLVSGVDDVLGILKSDYDNAYFVTGLFTSSIYAEDCLFEDPTISFRGRELYSRNLQLLVPFFEQASIVLKSIEKGVGAERDFVLANWSLRTYLKLPWRPLIAIEGSTIYDLNDEYKIVRHGESWNLSAVEAVGQIFTPGIRRPLD